MFDNKQFIFKDIIFFKLWPISVKLIEKISFAGVFGNTTYCFKIAFIDGRVCIYRM